MALFTTVFWALSLLLVCTMPCESRLVAIKMKNVTTDLAIVQKRASELSLEYEKLEGVCAIWAHKRVKDWLYSNCSTNEDCEVSNAECVSFNKPSTCMCTPGFFYSESSRCCVETCSQLSNTFAPGHLLEYPAITITGAAPLVAKTTHPISEFESFPENCLAPCAAKSSCLFVVKSPKDNFANYECTLYGNVSFTGEPSSTDFVYMRWCV
ncbi:uncharacterized protein [Littorina saxatilis]|uniref:uncharacterized protein isoform X2 n=1 Tax=Littorina saxatilis TaxID=31220 RepID=UPI0038B634DD